MRANTWEEELCKWKDTSSGANEYKLATTASKLIPDSSLLDNLDLFFTEGSGGEKLPSIQSLPPLLVACSCGVAGIAGAAFRDLGRISDLSRLSRFVHIQVAILHSLDICNTNNTWSAPCSIILCTCAMWLILPFAARNNLLYVPVSCRHLYAFIAWWKGWITHCEGFVKAAKWKE